jgi:hypothetical protein
MTYEELKKLYGTFFKTEGLVAKWGFHEPDYVTVMYEGCGYNVVLDTKRNNGGMCFQMFTWGPEFVIWEGSSDWEDDPELEGKVQHIANKVNTRHPLGRVNADSMVTFSVDIRLQSPEQFKYSFYKAARALKVVKQDFNNELKSIGWNIWTLSSEPWEIGERIIGELCAKQGFISDSDGKSCLKARGDNDTIRFTYHVYDEGFEVSIEHYPTGVSRVHEAEATSEHTIVYRRDQLFTADEAMDRVKKDVVFAVEAEVAGSFEVTDEQEKAKGLR